MPPEPDPRPVIAAKLSRPLMDLVLRSGPAQTVRLLNDLVPEGAPWTADWHDPDPVTGNVLTVTAGAVRDWLESA